MISGVLIPDIFNHFIMKAFNFTCQGASHIKDGKVCQDYSFSYSNDSLAVAIVSDGHGSAPYFRSDVGSKLAIEVAKSKIDSFVESFELGNFRGKPLLQFGVGESCDNELAVIFNQLFKSICIEWREQIKVHAEANPLNAEESERVEAKYQDRFNKKERLETVYGCTLLAYVQTETYWFAFHIGDGKIVSFQNDLNLWKMPVPWDNNCFFNKTTSLCDSSPWDEFRFCFRSDGQFPIAVFLGSDGIDDSYGEEQNLANFYGAILKSILFDGFSQTCSDIESDLPIISKKGSRDDMSIAFVYNEGSLKELVSSMISKNIADLRASEVELQNELERLADQVNSDNVKIVELEKLLNNYQQKITECDAKIRSEQTIIESIQQRIEVKQKEQGSISCLIEQGAHDLGFMKTEIGIINEDKANHQNILLKYQDLRNQFSDFSLSNAKDIRRFKDDVISNNNKMEKIRKELSGLASKFSKFDEENNLLNSMTE